jgi:hypothetical protein
MAGTSAQPDGRKSAQSKGLAAEQDGKLGADGKPRAVLDQDAGTTVYRMHISGGGLLVARMNRWCSGSRSTGSETGSHQPAAPARVFLGLSGACQRARASTPSGTHFRRHKFLTIQGVAPVIPSTCHVLRLSGLCPIVRHRRPGL